jgi:hypothetical protein
MEAAKAMCMWRAGMSSYGTLQTFTSLRLKVRLSVLTQEAERLAAIIFLLRGPAGSW